MPVICTVENQWRGTRELSIYLSKNEIRTLVIIKGYVEKNFLDLVSKYKFTKIVSIRRKFFKIYVFLKIFMYSFIGRLKCVVTDKEKTLRWVGILGRFLGFKTYKLVETSSGYKIYSVERRQIKDILNYI